MMSNRRARALLAALLVLPASSVQARPPQDDPYAYDFRSGIFPVTYVGAVTQHYLGTAARAELDFGRRVTLQLGGRIGWHGLNGPKSPLGFHGRLLLGMNVYDGEVREPMAGTVYPEDPPPAGVGNPATDQDLEVWTSEKMKGPRLTLPEREGDRLVSLRRVHSLRVGAEYVRSIQPGGRLLTGPALVLGYAFGTHYNLSARAAGSMEVGFRRIYIDLMSMHESITEQRSLSGGNLPELNLFPLGLRIGMEGTIAAFWPKVPGVGFAYGLEIGLLPGDERLESYLMLNLGLALDAATGL
ncbi:MAG: hypothetical protein OEZ06_01520 [Myxococcales bacterium]|nr:hypothetical protein [Myxococcales bacterium]